MSEYQLKITKQSQLDRYNRKLKITYKAIDLGIDFNLDFHQLNSAQVDIILKLSKDNHYNKPKNANGSTARYYYYYLKRALYRPLITNLTSNSDLYFKSGAYNHAK